MSYYHIRLTYNIDEHSLQYKRYAEQRTQEHILVKENADTDCKQPHLHLHSKTLHKNDQALRREFKKWFPELQGNAHYSLKNGNEVGYHYVCKGTGPEWDTGKPTVLSTTFTEDEIKEFHRIYWNHANRIKVDLGSAEVVEEKPKRKRTKTFMEKLRDEIEVEFPNHRWNPEMDTDMEFLATRLLKRLGDTAKNLDTIIFTRLMNGLLNGLPKAYEVEQKEKQHYLGAFQRSRGL